MNTLLKQNPREIICIILIIGATLFVYYPVRFFDFVFIDDHLYICNNQHIHNGLSWEGLRWAFFTIRSGSWLPLTWISHMTDITWYHMDAGGHHWTNVQIHLISAILLFIFFRRSTQTIWISAAITACFALHPLHVESVAWVSERKDVLSICLAHLTLLAYLLYSECPTHFRRTIVLVCFSLSLMSKPMMVSLPFLLLIIDYWPLNRWHTSTTWNLIKEKLPLIILALVFAAFTFFSQKNEHAMNYSLALKYRILNAGIVYVQYLYKMFIPMNLSFFYPHPKASVSIIGGLCGLGFTGGLLLFAIIYRKKFPYIFTGIIWYVFTLIPVIGIVQVGAQQMADRYTYFPMTGIAVAVFFGLGQNKTRFLLPAALILTIVGCTILTRQQVYVWQNSYTLTTHALENHAHNNYVAHYGLGDYYMDKENYPEAIKHFQKATQIAPRYTRAMVQLANSWTKNQNYQAAITQYKIILKYNPLNEYAHINLGNIYVNHTDQLILAENHYRFVLHFKPNSPLILTNFAYVMVQQNRPKEALKYYTKAILSDPSYLKAYINLSQLLFTEKEKSDDILNQCVDLIRDHKHAKTCLTHLSQTFIARKEFQLAAFFNEKANEFK